VLKGHIDPYAPPVVLEHRILEGAYPGLTCAVQSAVGGHQKLLGDGQQVPDGGQEMTVPSDPSAYRGVAARAVGS